MPEPYPTEQALSDHPVAEPYVELAERYALIPEALLYDPNISADAVRLYGALVRHGSDPRNCFPSYKRLGSLLGRSPRSVPGWARELEQAGWIERVPRRSPEGDPTSNGFRVFTAPRPRAAEREVRASERAKVRAEQRATPAPRSAPKESKRTRASSNESSRALAPQRALDLPLTSQEQTARDEREQTRAIAERLLRAWWEARDPRPTQNYVGARKVLERLLDAGWSEPQLDRALPSCPVISAKACELALRRTQPAPAARAPIDTDRDDGSGRWVYENGEWRLVS